MSDRTHAAVDWPVLSIHRVLFNFNFKTHASHFVKQKVSRWCTGTGTQDPTVPARCGFMRSYAPRVANLFSLWHIALLSDNGYGYGGKISEKHVEQSLLEGLRQARPGAAIMLKNRLPSRQ